MDRFDVVMVRSLDRCVDEGQSGAFSMSGPDDGSMRVSSFHLASYHMSPRYLKVGPAVASMWR